MEQYKICVVLFVLISLNKGRVVGQPNFSRARQVISHAERPINYENFCAEAYAGGDKLACLIRQEPTVGLLVCKTAVVDEAACEDVINNEIQNLGRVSAYVNTVAFDPRPIHGLNCPENPQQVCSGFLEEWVHNGRFRHLRDAIAGGSVAIRDLASRVKNDILRHVPRGDDSSDPIRRTVHDLRNIQSFMTYGSDEPTQYRQICDLQGFFLNYGGFLVADVPYIAEHIGPESECWPGEPTTLDVLNALDDIIGYLRRGPSWP
ncbi:uncharacterized protein LOC144649224 [Oculina patagonica]